MVVENGPNYPKLPPKMAENGLKMKAMAQSKKKKVDGGRSCTQYYGENMQEWDKHAARKKINARPNAKCLHF